MPAYKDKQRGTWYAKTMVLDPVSGKRKQKLKRGFSTKREALDWERSVYASTEASMTFRKLSQIYYQFSNQKPQTQESQTRMLELHFPFYEMDVGKITKPMIVQWYTDICSEGLKPGTVNLVITVVKSIYAFGEKNYGIEDNAKHLRRLKGKKRQYSTWTDDQFSRFLSVIDHPLYKVLFEFYYFTGCRKAEALALRKADFHDGCVHLHGTKTEASDRVLKLPHALQGDLEPILRRLDSDDELVFPVPYTTLYARFNGYIKASGVPPIRIHDLRHSFATSMIGSGANIIAVSHYLGHSTVQQTLTTYSHLFEKADDEMVEMLENRIKNVSQPS